MSDNPAHPAQAATSSQQRAYVPPKSVEFPYEVHPYQFKPLSWSLTNPSQTQTIDTDPYACLLSAALTFILISRASHIKRVFGYARPSDYLKGVVAAAFPPAAFWAMERWHPSGVGRGGFAPVMRLNVGIGLIFGCVWVYTTSTSALPLNHMLLGLRSRLICLRLGQYSAILWSI
jgi:hypothetical protein